MPTTSTKLPTTGAWVKVADDGDTYFIQNVSQKTIELMSKASAPANSEIGHVLKYMDAVINATLGEGDIYARSSFGAAATVVISK